MKKQIAHRNTKCVVCGTGVLNVLDLGDHSLANSLLDTSNTSFERYPLGLSACPNCAHGQLSHFIDPEEIFVEYLYASGTSQTLNDYFHWFAERVVSSLGQDIDVLELASNDGCLLDAFRQFGVNPLGIDPAENLCKIAAEKGHNVRCGFFPELQPDSPVDLIVAMNVAAHTPDPRDFLIGIRDNLKPGGIAVIQTSQAYMIANGEFDTVYHEHYSFYSAKSMYTLAQSVGLELERTELVSVHGISFIFSLRKPGDNQKSIEFAGDSNYGFYVTMPGELPTLFNPFCSGEESAKAYEKFATVVEKKIRSVKNFIGEYEDKGYKVGLVGVAAKALTFIRSANIDPLYYFDEAALKIGRYVPGAQTAIMNISEINKIDDNVVLLIGAWNFADEISKKIRRNVMGTIMEDRIVVATYFPELKVFK